MAEARLGLNPGQGKGRKMVSDKNSSKKVSLRVPHEYQTEELVGKAIQADFYLRVRGLFLRHRPLFGTGGLDWLAIAGWLSDKNRMPNRVKLEVVWDEARALIVELHPQNARQDRIWSTDYSWVDRWMVSKFFPGTIIMSKVPLKNDWELDLSDPSEWPRKPYPSEISLWAGEPLCQNQQELAYKIWFSTAAFSMKIFYPEGKESASRDSEIPYFSGVQQVLWEDLRHHVSSLKEEWFSLYKGGMEGRDRIQRQIIELLQEIPESESLYREFMVEPDRPDEQWTTPSF